MNILNNLLTPKRLRIWTVKTTPAWFIFLITAVINLVVVHALVVDIRWRYLRKHGIVIVHPVVILSASVLERAVRTLASKEISSFHMAFVFSLWRIGDSNS